MYQYKDHLGNIRLAYSDYNDDNTIDIDASNGYQSEIVEEHNFYPFGLKHQGYNNVVQGDHHPYSYNGKEEQNEFDINWYDLGARNHNPSIGRFMNLDPLAEDYYFQSPYAFASNNPVYYIDFNGEGVDETYGVDSKGNIKKLDNKKYYDKDGKEIDKIYALDSSGNKIDTNNDGKVNENDSADADSGALSQVTKDKNPKGRKYDYFFHKDGARSDKLFEFLAENTSVEWGKVDEDKTNSWITTSHSISKEWGASDLIYDLLNESGGNDILYEHTHSHPKEGGIKGYAGPSGFIKKDKHYGSGDKKFAKIKQTYKKELINLRVYDVPTKSYIEYNTNTRGVPVKKKL